MEFDFITGLITAAIALSSAVIIYAISEMFIRGSSYDEVKASQRKERCTLNNVEKNNADIKRLKKLKKKKANRTNIVPNDHTFEDASIMTVNQTPEETCVPEESQLSSQEDSQASTVKPNVTKTKGKIAKKVKEYKGSLDVSLSSQKMSDSSNDVEIESVIPLTNEPPSAETETYTSNDTLDETPIMNGPDTLKRKRKTKKKKIEDYKEDNSRIKGGLALNSLLSMLQQAELSHSDKQILIDALLNKDNNSEWHQLKQDPMLKMKKQLTEMEKLNTDNVNTINGLQSKLSSLRNELYTEKTTNKTLRESLTKAGAELVTVSMKCQQATEDNQSLVVNIQQLQQQLSEEQMLIVKLEEEKVLQQQMHIPHDQHHEAVLSLQGQVNQLAAQLQEQQNVNASLGVQLQDSIRIQEDYQSLNAELNHLLNNSQFEVNRLNSELTSLSKEVEDARSQIDDLSNMIEAIETQKNDLVRENEHLKMELSSKLSPDARTFQKMSDSLDHNIDANKKNGNINFTQPDHSMCQSLIDEKESSIKNMNLELSQKESLVKKLSNDIINCKNDANKKQTLIENMNVELVSLKTQNTKLSSELNEEKVIVTNLRTCLTEKAEAVVNLSNEVENVKQKNNALRSKNWKVVEALIKAEASLKDVSSRLDDSAKYINDCNVSNFKCRISDLVKRLEPTVIIENLEDNEAWLSQLEDAINQLRHEPKTQQLTAQITQLQHLVTHYRSVINDLEVMLHNLEVRIESEDKKLSIQPESRLSPEVDD